MGQCVPGERRLGQRSAQNQEVEPVASGLPVRRVVDTSHGTAETFFAAEELVLRETAHRGVGLAERVDLAEEVREARRVHLADLLESLPVESGGRERRAGLLDGREGIDRPSGLGEPPAELDPVVSAREPLMAHAGSNEDRGTGAEYSADLVRGGSQVWDVLNDIGEPGGVRRFIWKRQ